MDKVLPLLTEGALALRDRHAALVRAAARAVQQADATLAQLRQFRLDLLARSPAALGTATDAQALVGYQRFLARLDEAIVLQQQERALRLGRVEAAQQQLIEKQKRLTAFETLARRRAAERSIKETRRLQRDSDEYAARAVRRLPQEMTA